MNIFQKVNKKLLKINNLQPVQVQLLQCQQSVQQGWPLAPALAFQ